MNSIEFSISRYEQDGEFLTAQEAEEQGIMDEKHLRTIDLCVEYQGQWVDEGIGAYEYWGSKGNDVWWCYKVDDIDSAVDEDGKDWKDCLTDDELDEIIKKCEEIPDEPDYYDEPDEPDPRHYEDIY